MRADFALAQGSRLPKLRLRAADSAGVGVPLGAATSVTAYMVHHVSGKVVHLSVAITDAAHGEVTVSWSDGDTSLPGQYTLWVVVAFPAGEDVFPSCSCEDGSDAFVVEVCARPG